MMSSLFIGATGLKSQSEGMAAVSNNLSNVNTVSYKQISLQFSDLLGSYLASSGSTWSTGTGQVGAGAAVSSVRTLFTQGAIENTTQSTDLAIAGKGFFGVYSNGEVRYTRAGNFSFTSAGALVDSNGWTVMGRLISGGAEASSASPLVLDFSGSGIGSMAGKASTQVTVGSNLGGLEDAASDAANPYFALASSWQGASAIPLAGGSYSYAEAFSFYDTDGTMRTGTIYYDGAGSSGGMSAVEYVVALDDPSLDGSSLAGTQAVGLLMAGTLTFNSSGELVNMTAFTPPASGDPADLSGWTAADLSNGLPALTVTLQGGQSQTIGLNMGLTLSGSAANGLSSAAEAAALPEVVFAANTNAARGASTATAYGDSAYTILSGGDGYAQGVFRSFSINAEGVLTGSYSNGQTQDLCRVTLYRFVSEDGLKSMGGNQYAATFESGAAEEGVAGEENFGDIEQYALEQSNVDYAVEFSNLIITQRAFQMNSKVITTSDAMLQKALEIKR